MLSGGLAEAALAAAGPSRAELITLPHSDHNNLDWESIGAIINQFIRLLT